jgi:hypothetical protein
MSASGNEGRTPIGTLEVPSRPVHLNEQEAEEPDGSKNHQRLVSPTLANEGAQGGQHQAGKFVVDEHKTRSRTTDICAHVS